MNLETTSRLLKAFETCPHCGKIMYLENLIVDESTFIIKCSCGWKLKGFEYKMTRKPSRVKAEIKPTKVCSKCNKELPSTNEYFAISKAGLYGLRSVCKECGKAYREANKEKKDAYNKAYREKQRQES